ncbi:MAG: FUSC family protein [Luteolibacter sp.]
MSYPAVISGTSASKVRTPRRYRNVEFALLGLAATALAFYSAVILNLKTPYTAALTVWVVANTRPGHVLSKSFYRVSGTVLGGIFSVLAVSSLNSMPVLLFLSLAVWVGCCTAIGNLLRRYRSYFGFLAGYTAAFIVLGAYKHPDQVLQVGLDRTASIVVGVLSMSVVSAVAGFRGAPGEIVESFARLHVDSLAVVARGAEWSGREWNEARLRVMREFRQAEDLLEYADIESAGFSRRARRARAISRMLLDLVDACHGAVGRVKTEPQRAGLHGLLVELVAILSPAGSLQQDERLVEAREKLEGLLKCPVDPSVASWIEAWLPRLVPARMDREPLTFPLHVDVRGACRHGLRTTLSLLAAIGFWDLSGWQDGAGFVLNCAAFCALMASASHPGKAVSMLALSALVASIAGFILKFHLLPHASGFPSLMMCMGVVLVPIALLSQSRNPWLSNVGMNGCFLVLALVQPVNHMTYDPAAYLSSAIGTVFATLFVIPAFSLILPTRPKKEGARLLKALRHRAARVGSGITVPTVHGWRATAADLLGQLQLHPQTTRQQLDEGLRALDLGTGLLRLRRQLPHLHSHSEARMAVEQVLQAGIRVWRSPNRFRAAADSALQVLSENTVLDPERVHSLTNALQHSLLSLSHYDP